MKAKSMKSPDRHGTLSSSSPLLPTLTNSSMGNGPVTNTTCNMLPRDMCTSPIQVRLNALQNDIPSSGPTLTLLPKDASSLEGLDNYFTRFLVFTNRGIYIIVDGSDTPCQNCDPQNLCPAGN